MPNIINLKLLNNRQIIAELNGIPLANENSYKIIAGEENATIFKIASKPKDYQNANFTVEMRNAKGYGIPETSILEDEFYLPTSMAVAGYSTILIRAKQENETVPFMPLKIKVWNTIENWIEYVPEQDVMALLPTFEFLL